MDLSKVLTFGGFFPLLETLGYTDDYSASLRSLRLVCKEFSKIALVGLRRYKLKLEGDNGDTDVSRASFLQQARLLELNADLRITRHYSPASFLKAFVCNVGQALVTVTSLDLRVTPILTAPRRAADLNEALAALFSALPALKHVFCLDSCLSVALLALLAQHCPLVSSLHCCGNNFSSCSTWQAWVNAQAHSLPNVSELILNGMNECEALPDMTKNTGILTLYLFGFTFLDGDSRAAWLCLPPNLRHLKRVYFDAGPPATPPNSTPALANLVTISVPETIGPTLYALAQILRAAPALQAFERDGKDKSLTILVNLCESSPADFATFNTRKELFTTSMLQINCEGVEDETILLPILKALPIVDGVIQADIALKLLSSVAPLLAAFPGLERLMLVVKFTDASVGAVSVCKNLRGLSLDRADVTPVGMFSLCLNLPKLNILYCKESQRPTSEDCELLLRKHNRVLEFRS